MSDQYHELLIEGPRGWTLGFIHGSLRQQGITEMPLDAEEERFDCEPFSERVRELLNRKSDIVHLLVREDLLPALRTALEDDLARQRGVTLQETRAIQGARFEFSLIIYSREHWIRARHVLTDLPPGVTLSGDTKFKEIVDADADVMHSFAPTHRFEMRGEGAVEGPLDGVLAVHRACREMELIKEKRICLVFA